MWALIWKTQKALTAGPYIFSFKSTIVSIDDLYLVCIDQGTAEVISHRMK